MAHYLYFYLVLFALCINMSSSDVDIEPNNKNKNPSNSVSKENIKSEEKQNEDSIPVIDIGKKKVDDKKDKSTSSLANKVTTPKTFANNANIKSKTSAEVESGAVMRGIFVFVAIAMLFIMYIAFKTYRKGNKKNTVIKKYGVRTRRSDIEMEPLPLDEDEEDETIFDLGNVNSR